MIENLHERIRTFAVTVAVFCGAMFFTVSVIMMVVAVVAGTVAFFNGGKP